MSELSLIFSPHADWRLLAALAIGGVILLGWSLWARQKGAGLRALALALVMLALCEPSLMRERRDPQKSVVAVVVDQTGSQNLLERPAQTQAARVAVEQALGKLQDVETRFVTVGDSGADEGTKLFGALSQALKDVPPERVGGAILITDGIVHDIPANAAALNFNAPLHALITGREKERDRRIELVEAPRFGIVGKDQTLRAKVVDPGAGAEEIKVVARLDGETIVTLWVHDGDVVNIPVHVEHGGPNIVEVETPAVPGELTDLDNKAVAIVEGVRDRLKVLLVSGEPHPGERSWRNLLRADANVELVHFTILRPPDKLDGTPASELSLIAFPTADLFGRRINDFDLIIFDRYSNQTLLPAAYFDNVANYVENGGALMVATGPDFSGLRGLFYSPLESVLPAKPLGSLFEQPFRARISADGEKHPVTRGLAPLRNAPPWGEWFRQVDARVLKGNSILSGAKDMPLLVLSREKKGRVALLLTDQMWLWARGYDGGGPHVDLSRRLAHWLMKEPDLEEEALRASARGADVTIERQSLSDATAPTKVTAPSGALEEIALSAAEPGLSRAHYHAKEMGLYRIENGPLKTLVNVGPPNPREFRELMSTTEKLRPLAEATGGVVLRLAHGAEGGVTTPRVVEVNGGGRYGGADWIGVKRAGASTLVGVEVYPLALGLWAMLILLGAVVLLWGVEGRR